MDPLATTVILLICAWGVVGPMFFWYAGKLAGSDDALRARRRHPAGKALIPARDPELDPMSRWQRNLNSTDRWL